MTEDQQRLDFDAGDPLERRDADARVLAVDPRRNVALEASAGTGKTRVLVDRYVGLLAAGIKPRNILAITFTRKAAAEMRQRILLELATRRRDEAIGADLWQEIRDSITDISISTIDAFCLALLREFPLEADVDPGFELADETETPRLVDDALEGTVRVGRALATEQPEMALLFAQLGEYQLRQGLARLIDRRLVAWEAIGRFLRGAQDTTIDEAVTRLHARLRTAASSVPGGVSGLLATGPDHPEFTLFARDLRRLLAEPAASAAHTQALLERVRDHFLTQDGEPRKRLSTYKKADFRSAGDYDKHVAAVQALGPYLIQALHEYRRDINFVLVRAVRQLYAIALKEYERTLRKHGVLDFSDVLERTLALLGQMEEFSRSRFKLEARYQHVLVDEFQDTSRAQWALVELLVKSWASGLGLSSRELEPSIFIVGDRKQSIYGFRDAEVAVLDEASRYIEALRPIGQVRTAITRSFRSVRELLHFVNDVFAGIDKVPARPDAFRYSEDDAFPLTSVEATDANALGLVPARSDEEQAERVAGEIARVLLDGVTVRDRESGVRRAVEPGDIAILFRTREGHRLFEDALARRRVPYYVYKGLGFFDADEIKDVLALLGFLARPQSELLAAALLRSRFVRLSDEALKLLAPHLAASVTAPTAPARLAELHPDDQNRLQLARSAVPRWLALVDRLPPSELLDRILTESAYAAELAGPTCRQARENLKKIRGLVRRIHNRGYATLGRIVDHFAQLVIGGDESNAIIDAIDAVNLMTTHAAKGLEFPIVFVVNLHRGSGGSPDPIRVFATPLGSEDQIEPAVSIGEHESDGDRDAEARESEENKRLLYVALTRARDRLYLAGTVSADDRFIAGKGGLGRTLPPSLAQLFPIALAGGEARVTWAGQTAGHVFNVVQAATETPTFTDAPPAGDEVVDDFTPLLADGARRIAATAIGSWSAADPGRGEDADGSSIEAGVLVHRALEAGTEELEPLLRDDERARIDDLPALLARAREALTDIRSQPEIAQIFADDPSIAWRKHEVPFSWRSHDGAIVRGTFDCLVERTSGEIEVLEFKTGRPADEHQRQLDAYVAAARALFPTRVVQGRLIYSRQSETTFGESLRLT
ncbi:MAG TPA: UvrD-helicase domain-containing protein [Vicinamibacterales bacterium]|nr:UvrD-helicase domain-containing protein [Vicinamibacterales bacterium]